MHYIFTTCALNFVPCAKLLAQSVKKHIPDARFVFVLTDEKPTDFRLEDEGFDEVLYLEGFADVIDNPRGWAFGHTIMELATAMKPFTASKLMERDDCESVMFFDPDCVLFGPMTEMRAALAEHSVVLTPHASQLHEDKNWLFFEMNPLKVGNFNLGFFGFRNCETGRAVSSWWRYRLRDLCLIDPERGLFTDQKWMDLLPSYIDDLKIMREPVYNIARWNTFQRDLTKKGKTYLADGAPIQFVHFSGFYKIGPYVQGLYDRTSEPLIKNLDVLQELSLRYSGQLEKARSQPIYTQPWPLGLYKNGEAIPDKDRRRHKESKALQQQFPDPFATSNFSSYWLYCRKQDRVEAETEFTNHLPMAALVNRSVQVHNSILRKQSAALEAQLSQTTTDYLQARDAIDRQTVLTRRFKNRVLQYLADAPAATIQTTFADLVSNSRFDPDAYLEANPDVVDSGINALEHFIRFGLAEGRGYEGFDANMFFDVNAERILDLLVQLRVETKPYAHIARKPVDRGRRIIKSLVTKN